MQGRPAGEQREVLLVARHWGARVASRGARGSEGWARGRPARGEVDAPPPPLPADGWDEWWTGSRKKRWRAGAGVLNCAAPWTLFHGSRVRFPVRRASGLPPPLRLGRSGSCLAPAGAPRVSAPGKRLASATMGRSSAVHMVAGALLLVLVARAALLPQPHTAAAAGALSAAAAGNGTAAVLGTTSIAYRLYTAALEDDDGAGAVDNSTCGHAIMSQFNCGEPECEDLVPGASAGGRGEGGAGTRAPPRGVAGRRAPHAALACAPRPIRHVVPLSTLPDSARGGSAGASGAAVELSPGRDPRSPRPSTHPGLDRPPSHCPNHQRAPSLSPAPAAPHRLHQLHQLHAVHARGHGVPVRRGPPPHPVAPVPPPRRRDDDQRLLRHLPPARRRDPQPVPQRERRRAATGSRGAETHARPRAAAAPAPRSPHPPLPCPAPPALRRPIAAPIPAQVAGVTFLAVGNAACDVIASVAAFATGVPKVGVGTTLGAGIFVTTGELPRSAPGLGCVVRRGGRRATISGSL
jgi:hypothetical protein